MTTIEAQKAMFYKSSRYTSELTELIGEMVDSGLTKEELAKNIERRPELWGKWEYLMDSLPSAGSLQTCLDSK